MKGLVVKYGEKTYKVGLPDGGVTLSSCIMQNKFTLEAGGSGHAYASVFLKLREDIEFEVEVAEFDKASEPLSETVSYTHLDVYKRQVQRAATTRVDSNP